MHFAAFLEVGESMQVPERYFRNNSMNSLTLLEAALKHGVERFVFSSTAALFGEPERTPIVEDDPLHPTNAYGESKLLVEKMLAWFHQIHGLRYASLRYFNAAGATREHGEDHRPESHLIALICRLRSGYASTFRFSARTIPHLTELAFETIFTSRIWPWPTSSSWTR